MRFASRHDDACPRALLAAQRALDAVREELDQPGYGESVDVLRCLDELHTAISQLGMHIVTIDQRHSATDGVESPP